MALTGATRGPKKVLRAAARIGPKVPPPRAIVPSLNLTCAFNNPPLPRQTSRVAPIPPPEIAVVAPLAELAEAVAADLDGAVVEDGEGAGAVARADEGEVGGGGGGPRTAVR
jgi:hypothetical protein